MKAVLFFCRESECSFHRRQFALDVAGKFFDRGIGVVARVANVRDRFGFNLPMDSDLSSEQRTDGEQMREESPRSTTFEVCKLRAIHADRISDFGLRLVPICPHLSQRVTEITRRKNEPFTV
jgi:hypothetical protein